jgi:xylulose-5-phosphate/fructose-6-phosphate phosphoketolase
MPPTRDANLQQSVEEMWEPIGSDEIKAIDAYWRACNYLCAGMIYLRDNPLLKIQLTKEHFKTQDRRSSGSI